MINNSSFKIRYKLQVKTCFTFIHNLLSELGFYFTQKSLRLLKWPKIYFNHLFFIIHILPQTFPNTKICFTFHPFLKLCKRFTQRHISYQYIDSFNLFPFYRFLDLCFLRRSLWLSLSLWLWLLNFHRLLVILRTRQLQWFFYLLLLLICFCFSRFNDRNLIWFMLLVKALNIKENFLILKEGAILVHYRESILLCRQHMTFSIVTILPFKDDLLNLPEMFLNIFLCRSVISSLEEYFY